jgi:hypothetical protein
MRRIGPLLMSTVLVTGCAGLAANNESIRSVLERSGQSQPKLSAYDQGKRHLQLRSPGLAVESFKQALKDDPNSVEALNGLAVAYDRLGRPDVSQKFLDQALALDSESAVTLNNLAYLNLVQGNTAVAVAYAERAQMAADMPMEMMLPDTIAKAVGRTAEIAMQLASSEQQARPTAEAPAVPADSNVRRVGLNEWELRIRPFAPSDALKISPPSAEAAPRVIEPLVEPVTTPIPIEPISESPMQGSDIPDAVMDLLDAPSEPAPIITALLEPLSSGAPAIAMLPDTNRAGALVPFAPEQPIAEEVRVNDAPPVEHEPSTPALPTPDALATLPVQPLPQPLRSEQVVASLPPPEFRIRVLPDASFAAPLVPAQPLPEPAQVESVIASLPTPDVRTRALSAPPFAAPPVPAQPVPQPALVESVIASLPVPEYRTQTLPSFSVATPPITAQPLPAPARVESVIASLPVTEYQMRTLASRSVATPPITAQPLPEPARVDSVIASVRPPEPLPVTLPAPRVLPRASGPQTPASPPQRAVERPASGPTAGWTSYVPEGTLVRVSNGTGRRLMATRFARYFSDHGVSVRRVANANSFGYKRTAIFYNPDQRDYAYALAQVLPFPVRLIEAKHGRGQVELILGSDLLVFDDSIRSA